MLRTICILAIMLSIVFSCTRESIPDQGEQLARVHCASCHQYPQPELLDRQTWNKYVLPRMGHLLGVLPLDSIGHNFYEPEAYEAMLNNPNIIRKIASLGPEEWAQIRHFYLKTAPATLAVGTREVDTNLTGFTVQWPEFRLSPPSTTLVQINEKEPGFFIGDAHTQRLYRFDDQLRLQQLAQVGAAPVSLQQIPEGTVVTSMGSFSPSDRPQGRTLFLLATSDRRPMVLLDSLQRPAHLTIADLDGDSIQDFISSEFAKWTGGLHWWKNDGYGEVRKNTLRNMPGAIRSEIVDLNDDGRTDVLALFGQGDEGIWAFTNVGDGRFRDTCLLRFPPSYGSSFFSLIDFNGDPYPDILYTNGDNADYPPILKPYHGIRIFENREWKHFEEVFFYPMSGAYKAILHDFDQDGDQDMAAISFFPDFTAAPRNGFLYLENKGDWNMQATTFTEADQGRWISMDAGDMDRDGDWDIVLGSLAFETVPASELPEKWISSGPPFIVLENNLK